MSNQGYQYSIPGNQPAQPEAAPMPVDQPTPSREIGHNAVSLGYEQPPVEQIAEIITLADSLVQAREAASGESYREAA